MGNSTPSPYVSSPPMTSPSPTDTASSSSQRTNIQRLHRILLGQPVSIRTYDLLTDDHPYRWFDKREQLQFKAWLRGLSFVGLLTAGMLVLGFVGAIIAGFAFAPSVLDESWISALNEGSRLSPTSPPMVISSVAQLLATIIAYMVVVKVMEQRRHPLELAPSRMFDVVRGIIAALVCISVSIGIIALLGGYRIVGFDATYSPWIDLLVMGLVAGISEELMMRGILLRLIEEWLGSWGAVVISALVFGLMHLSNADGTLWGGIAIAIEAGLLFGAIYLATRSLWWCIGFHFMWNIAEGPIYGSVVSGNGAQRSWLVAQWSGPEWLTGGTFGLEASIVPVILLGGLAIALLIHLHMTGRMIEPAFIRKRKLGVTA
ncbi:abortive infection protein [Bifidobacterium hapali]|uniref:Abortive infection protein n=1 Tax=Bifidobacterium hapali TaxID=1630172 RepID=A0A261FZF3_9BIFI|nr:CPBP family intramembrane glutamic endopeptidase [Bifidobacterium hapali]OZG64126.1 abortive infection protein [Bifidobacterium hapali]